MITPTRNMPVQEVAAHYDDLDAFYRDVWGEHVHHGLWRRGDESQADAVRALSELVWAELALGPGARVCDVGCGYGATARLFASRGAEVHGYTVSQRQAAAARALSSAENPTYVVGDWLAASVPAGAHDGVFSIESSEHFADKPAFFAACARALKPGGSFVVCAWIAADAPSTLSRKHLLEPICDEGRLPSMGSEGEYKALMHDAGLEVVRVQDVSREVKRTWPLVLKRLGAYVIKHPRALAFLASGGPNKVFLVTLLRLWLAYETGAMRYLVFTARKRA